MSTTKLDLITFAKEVHDCLRSGFDEEQFMETVTFAAERAGLDLTPFDCECCGKPSKLCDCLGPAREPSS